MTSPLHHSTVAILTAPGDAPRDIEDDEYDEKLGHHIAQRLRPEGWTDEQTEALAASFVMLSRFQRYVLPHSLWPEAEDERRRRIKLARSRARERAVAYADAARLLREIPTTTAAYILGVMAHVSSKSVDAATSNRPEPFEVAKALDELGREERDAAALLGKALGMRSHSADDMIVEAVALALQRHGIERTAYDGTDRFSDATGETIGTIVDACAMLRGEDPTKAGWVVKAAKRLRRQYREFGEGFSPNPWLADGPKQGTS